MDGWTDRKGRFRKHVWTKFFGKATAWGAHHDCGGTAQRPDGNDGYPRERSLRRLRCLPTNDKSANRLRRVQASIAGATVSESRRWEVFDLSAQTHKGSGMKGIIRITNPLLGKRKRGCLYTTKTHKTQKRHKKRREIKQRHFLGFRVDIGSGLFRCSFSFASLVCVACFWAGSFGAGLGYTEIGSTRVAWPGNGEIVCWFCDDILERETNIWGDSNC